MFYYFNSYFLFAFIIWFKYEIRCSQDTQSVELSSNLHNSNSKLLNLINHQSNDQTNSNLNKQLKQRSRRAATSMPERKWPNGIIPYEITPYKFTEHQLSVFKQAMKHWESKTCVKFVERKPEHNDYVFFTIRPCGCCSYVGRYGGPQYISFADNCTKFGIVVHELGHTIGFWHEHNRPDRDQNVNIFFQNVQDNQLHNFNIMNKSEIDSLGSPYDFDSIMHYSKNTFSKNMYADTILPISDNPSAKVEMGQRVRLSKQDIIQTNLMFKCPAQGKTLQEPKGVIDFSEDLETNRIEKDEYYFEYRIVASSLSEQIKLRFDELNFKFFEHFDCEQNHLVILDGYESKAPVIKKFCPNTNDRLPIEIKSKTNRVMIIYKKSKLNSSGNLNFKAHYEFVCGGLLNAKSGIIQSPNYPLEYLPLSSCQWLVQAEKNHKIFLNFNKFDLEISERCSNDYLEIRDGPDETSKLIGKFCGPIKPKNLQSSSNSLYIKFVSDNQFGKTGFNITYDDDLDECEQNLNDCEQICINQVNGYRCGCQDGYSLGKDGKTCINKCSGVINIDSNKSNILTSPFYPNDYQNFMDCRWELTAPANHDIFFNFTDFDLEDSHDCYNDVLTIKSKLGKGNTFINHGRFCGQRIPDPILSRSNQVIIDFKTDKSDTKKGFAINYMLDENECLNGENGENGENGNCEQICVNKFNGYECRCEKGFVLDDNRHNCNVAPCRHHISSSAGRFQSINFQNPNITHVNCSWLIETLPGHLVKVKIFNSFAPINSLCSQTNLIVYGGSTSSDPALIKFKDNRSKLFVSNKNSLFITYFTSPECPNPGFEAKFKTKCGGRYLATSEEQLIYSHPEYGTSTYKHNEQDCKWLIKSRHSKRIRIRFLNFDLEDGHNNNCVFDSLTIYDSDHENSNKIIGSYCGNKTLPITVSTGNSLLLKFVTDDTRNRTGFKLAYDEISDPLDY